MANFMSSNIVEEVGAEVAQFMGYNNLKPEQKQIISGILSQRDVFGILPTGFGKSLCYASLPLIYGRIRDKEHSIIIVVTPLVAIMKDQVWCYIFILKNLCIDMHEFLY